MITLGQLTQWALGFIKARRPQGNSTESFLRQLSLKTSFSDSQVPWKILCDWLAGTLVPPALGTWNRYTSLFPGGGLTCEQSGACHFWRTFLSPWVIQATLLYSEAMRLQMAAAWSDRSQSERCLAGHSQIPFRGLNRVQVKLLILFLP